jgi:ATP adenylyltransferase
VTLDHLWSGWRARYIEGVNEQPPPLEAHECVLCRLVDGVEAAHMVERSAATCTVMNGFPYTSGHVMVLPRRHVAELEDLTDEESAALMAGVRRAVVGVKRAYTPDGLNVGINIGRAAGAGVPGHLHVHVLPRWNGDSNFMTSTAETRVLPEPLSYSADKLRAAWPEETP